MAKPELKTKVQDVSLDEFLAQIEPPNRREEASRLASIFAEVSGFAPKVWGKMLGFGRYDYTYASGHSGSFFATGFAPRKAETVIYILPGYTDFAAILADLGPHKIGKSCLYVKRLTDINEDALRRLVRAGLDDLATRWPVHPG